MNPLWSYLLTFVGLTGLWVASSRSWGWLVGVAVQPLWVAYALATRQYGFIIGSVAYGTVQYHNWRKATQREVLAR